MQSPAVVVPQEEAESVRRRLRKQGALREDLRVRASAGRVLFPVRESIPGEPVEVHEFEETGTRPPRRYQDVVDLPEALRPLLPRAYDVIGDVVVIRLPEELGAHERAVGEALLALHRGARTVAVDGGVHGAWRQRNLRVVAGRSSTETVHREFGLILAVDPATVYFSPRLATERRRVAEQVAPGETVIDAFAGVGPFTLHVARAGAGQVLAVDANPEAVAHLRRNLTLNHLENVTVLEGDVAARLPPLAPADRLILDYPWDPRPFLPTAARALREGGMLHYYAILETAAFPRVAERLPRDLPPGLRGEVLQTRRVRGYSSTQAHYAVDLRISPA